MISTPRPQGSTAHAHLVGTFGAPFPKPHGQLVESGFRPHPLLTGAHRQTVAALLRPLPVLGLRRERLDLADGDFLDLGWGGKHNPKSPLAVLVHGLTGGFPFNYLRGTACQLIARGWRTVMLQLRGAGPVPNRLHRGYDPGDTEDLRYLWHLLRRREPATFIAAVGWSLGGNLTLKALAEEGGGRCRSGRIGAVPDSTLRRALERRLVTHLSASPVGERQSLA